MVLTMIMQSDPALIAEVRRLSNLLLTMSILIGLIGIAALGVAVVALYHVRKQTVAIIKNMNQITPRLAPLLASAIRIAGDAEDVSEAVKVRMAGLLDTVDDVNAQLRSGARAVERRIKDFGTVVDVVQSEAETLLLDAASTARGVHSASEMLRSGKRPRLVDDEDQFDDEVFTG